jgi:ketosteroid isomerase-like protein
MKNLLLISALILSAFGSNDVLAQKNPESAVAAAVETLRKAMVDGDAAALQKIAADQLSYGHSGGKVESKAEFVEGFASGKSDFVDIELTEQTIVVSSKTAIVRHQLFAHTKDAGKEPGTVKLKILLVWQKQGKDWKLLARQAVRI